MKEKLIRAFSTQTVKQSMVTSSSTVVSGLLGVVFYILLGRFLGPTQFGIFSVIVLTITLLADITNVGTDTGIVRFVGKYKTIETAKALKFLKLGLKIKIVVGLLVLTLGWFLFPWIAHAVLGKAELAFPMRYALLGAVGVLLFSFTTSAIQAFEKFTTWGILNISLNALRLLGIVILFNLGALTVDNSLQIYILFPFIGFIVGSFFLPNYFKVENENSVKNEFLKYNKWVALFILIAAISARLDTYISTKLLTLTEVGIYSAAVTLAAVGTQIVSGIATVVAPKLASFDSKEKTVEYVKNLQLFVTLLAVVGIIIGIPLAYILIPILYGPEFSDSVKPFIVLLLAQVIFLISLPIHTSVFYYFSNPSIFVWISLIHLAIIGGLGWVLISQYGYMGAAVTVLIGNISNFLIPTVWVIKKFKKKK